MHSFSDKMAPIPDHIKTMTREQFLAAEKQGSLTNEDLHWIVQTTSMNVSSGSDFDGFFENLLDQRLGKGQYVCSVILTTGSMHGWGAYGTRLGNHASCVTGPKTFPGLLYDYSVGIYVFWG